MKMLTAGVVSAMLAAGTAGSVAAYRSQAGVDVATRPTAQETTASAAAPATGRPQPHRRVRWAPCPPGSVLEHGTCVTDVVRTVIVPSTPQPAPSSPSSSPQSSPTSGPTSSPTAEPEDGATDEAAEDAAEEAAGDDHGVDHGDDHGDDDGDSHADDHGEGSEDHVDADHAEDEDHGAEHEDEDD